MPEASLDRSADQGADLAANDSTEVVADTAIVDSKEELDGAFAGWEAWTGWSEQCPIYVPGAKGQMPPPIEWEPCPAPVPQSISCRRMKNTWGGASVGITNRFWRDPSNGIAELFFARWKVGGQKDLFLQVVGDVDGPIRVAMLNTASSHCQYLVEDFSDGRYVLNPITQTGPIGPDGGRANELGIVGGPLSPPTPSVLLRVNELSNWRISANWIAQLTLGAVKAWTWDGKTSAPVYQAGDDPNGLQPHAPVVVGTDVFVPVGNLQLCGVMSWNSTDGVRPLLRKYGDLQSAAGNFGTDGKVMVWTESHGPNACNNDGPNPEVWTAPYTTDPAVLKATAKRLRSDVRGVSGDGYVVGMGYAARCDDFGSPSTPSLSVVRLADGYRWIVPGDAVGNALHWNIPLGFTEEEVFVVGSMAGMAVTIFRIRLDSLGPGTPPD